MENQQIAILVAIVVGIAIIGSVVATILRARTGAPTADSPLRRGDSGTATGDGGSMSGGGRDDRGGDDRGSSDSGSSGDSSGGDGGGGGGGD